MPFTEILAWLPFFILSVFLSLSIHIEFSLTFLWVFLTHYSLFYKVYTSRFFYTLLQNLLTLYSGFVNTLLEVFPHFNPGSTHMLLRVLFTRWVHPQPTQVCSYSGFYWLYCVYTDFTQGLWTHFSRFSHIILWVTSLFTPSLFTAYSRFTPTQQQPAVLCGRKRASPEAIESLSAWVKCRG